MESCTHLTSGRGSFTRTLSQIRIRLPHFAKLQRPDRVCFKTALLNGGHLTMPISHLPTSFIGQERERRFCNGSFLSVGGIRLVQSSPTKCAIRRNAQFLIPPSRFFQLFNCDGLVSSLQSHELERTLEQASSQR